jgi:hypothetical protein
VFLLPLWIDSELCPTSFNIFFSFALLYFFFLFVTISILLAYPLYAKGPFGKFYLFSLQYTEGCSRCQENKVG